MSTSSKSKEKNELVISNEIDDLLSVELAHAFCFGSLEALTKSVPDEKRIQILLRLTTLLGDLDWNLVVHASVN